MNAVSFLRTISMPVVFLGWKLLPSWLSSLAIDAVPVKRVHRLTRVVRTMNKRPAEIVSEKRAALQKGDESTMHQLEDGEDVMSILRTCEENLDCARAYMLTFFFHILDSVKANTAASEKEKLSDDEIRAQISSVLSPIVLTFRPCLPLR